MRKRATLTLCLILGCLALAACGSQGSNCLVLANGGNTVCGGTAAAWCRITDSLRQGSTLSAVQQTQAACDTLEQKYQ